MSCGLNLWLQLLVLAAALAWTYYGIRFFIKAAEYYQSELDNKTKKDGQMLELLAKFDQLVDVLKVK